MKDSKYVVNYGEESFRMRSCTFYALLAGIACLLLFSCSQPSFASDLSESERLDEVKQEMRKDAVNVCLGDKFNNIEGCIDVVANVYLDSYMSGADISASGLDVTNKIAKAVAGKSFKCVGDNVESCELAKADSALYFRVGSVDVKVDSSLKDLAKSYLNK